jgi:hypothetical protein
MMKMRVPSIRRATPLLVCASLLAVAAPLAAQGGGGRMARDSMITLRIRGADEERIRVRLDSLLRALDGVSLRSAERGQFDRQIAELIQSLQGPAQTAARTGMMIGIDAAAAASRAVAEAFSRGEINGRFEIHAARPLGWIGFWADAPHAERMDGDGHYIRYFSYPAIVSVEPNSPAERAGIVAGDVLVAYNGADVRDHEINLSRLLVPERRITVTVKREGESKDYGMVVAKAPQDFIRRRIEIIGDSSFLRDAPGIPGMPGMPDDMPRRVMIRPGRPEAPMQSWQGPMLMLPGRGVAQVWGASLATIDTNLAAVLDVKGGVLVTSVGSETPASRGQLQSGDIIVKVAGRPVKTVRDIYAGGDDARSIQLDIVRKHKPMKITIPR